MSTEEIMWMGRSQHGALAGTHTWLPTFRPPQHAPLCFHLPKGHDTSCKRICSHVCLTRAWHMPHMRPSELMPRMCLRCASPARPHARRWPGVPGLPASRVP